MKKKATRIKLTKIEEKKDALFSNNIPENYVVIGFLSKKPKVNERFCVGLHFSTSPVLKIIDDNTFETYNSIYKWEKYEINK